MDGEGLEECVAARGSRLARRGATAAILSLNITPMIDVVFLLLIYFVLTVNFKAREGSFSVDAPRRLDGGGERRADPFELPRRPIVVVVRSFGDGAEEYSIASDDPGLGPIPGVEDLYVRLGEAREGRLGADQVFVVRASGAARWEHALAVFGAIRRAGFGRVRFANPGPVVGPVVGEGR